MREIRGWDIGQVVTANEMTLDTANILEEIGSNGRANLPCIYNGLSLESQSGAGGSIVTFKNGVCRCQDLPTSIYTYLPPNDYGNSFPCPIDISAQDSNRVITLSTGITSGYIVATFSITPNTPGAVEYVITGSLLQIATASYNPAIHVKLCAFTYSAPNFTLDFTPGTNRDTDLTGAGGVQWDYQNNRVVVSTPASQSGNNPTYFPNKITSNSFIAPTQQILTGSGTYTAPSPAPLYAKLELVSGGGGGQGSATGTTVGGGAGANGQITSLGGYGVGGGLGANGTNQGFGRGIGTNGIGSSSPEALFFPGGVGGQNRFSGAGAGGAFPFFGGFDGVDETGGGGGGAGIEGNSTVGYTIGSGAGGESGGYLEVLVPISVIDGQPYQVGGGGNGGAAGLNGYAGGRGGNGTLIVTEYYS
jgi:hypothetical protein